MGISLVPIIALLLVALLLGITLASLGFRGRLISTNPHCRRCGFDLGGLPLTGSEARCPECGRELDSPRAVRRGLRLKRPLLISLGIVLILVPIAIVGFGLFARSRPNLHALKPDFWLMLEARNANSAALKPQLVELLARMQGGKLSSTTTSSLIERALEVQADQTLPWDTAWGDILDFAAASGLLSEEQLKQNMQSAPVWTMHMRPTIVDGDDWVMCVLLAPGRVGNSPVGRVPLSLKPRLTEIRIGDRVVMTDDTVATSTIGIHSGGGSAMTRRIRVADVQPGVHELTAVWAVGVAPGYDQPSTVEWTEERKATIKILPAGTTSVDLIDDPGMRDAVLKSLSLSQGLMLSDTGDASGTPHLGFGMRCTSPPMDLAFDLIARERLAADSPTEKPPREWKIGTVAFTAGGSHHHGGGHDVRGLDAAAVDLVLRPSIDAARGTLAIYKIWDGEVVFRDVPLVGAKAGTPIDPRAGPHVLPDPQSP